MRQLSLDVSEAAEPVDLDAAEEMVDDATPEGVTPNAGTEAGSTGGSSFASGLVSDEEAADLNILATEQSWPGAAGPLDGHALASALSKLAEDNSHDLPSHEQTIAGAAIHGSSEDLRCHGNEHPHGADTYCSEAPALAEGTTAPAAHQLLSPEVGHGVPQDGLPAAHYSVEAAEQASLAPYGWGHPGPGVQMRDDAEQLALVHYHAAALSMHAAEQQALQQHAVAAMAHQHAMAGDWTSHLDPTSGRVYFHNAKLGITQWELPVEFAHPDEAEPFYKEPQVTCTCTVSQLRQAGACAFMGVLAISTAVACYFIMKTVQ
eukprot:TRINITY_DN44112_c0_g1_i1.p1 TRINITY_DN44112_c0_g1~~TRINITY_DN44112_c0_g1_i1.p1  ORF type:complete len:319 (-),score=70.86 TRINITY_DN44112_c0_g1_i1:202-1158(-)